LLAVQNLLFRKKVDTTTNLITAASLLEEALVFSPYNASLKITAIDIYSKLNAVHRAYELYQALSMKHIQLDSCSYLISSKLVQGGLYNEAIELCNDILKFHTCIARDTGEFAASSMDEHGNLSKADEFLHFFRNKMQPSLTLLDAKGRIMDCAPLLYTARADNKKHTLGLQHGIVGGGESDLERVAYMIREAHHPLGAPSIMTVTLDDESISSVSNNCDFSILHHEILCKTTYATKEALLQDSIRRGLLHGLLVRLVLCMEAIKGPKKGKAPKPSELLQKRCTSLLDVVDKISQFLESRTHDSGYQECMQAILTLVRTIVVISAGHEDKEDTLSSREEYATQQLEFIVIPSITWSIPTVCQFLPDMLVPLVVVFRITANLFALFGWGKRKTRASTGALAKVASDMKDLVGAMREEMSRYASFDFKMFVRNRWFAHYSFLFVTVCPKATTSAWRKQRSCLDWWRPSTACTILVRKLLVKTWALLNN
jgi:N-terminal acetyltransferase B complex non-catalytic subunit